MRWGLIWMMRFFTPEGIAGPYETEDQWNAQLAWLRRARDAYQQHLSDLEGALPARLLEISDPFFADDGLVIGVRHDRSPRELELTIRRGNLQIGYSDLVLSYTGAAISSKDDLTLASIVRSTDDHRNFDSDLYAYEFDLIESGHIEHHFLFNPGIAFTIRCTGLEYMEIARSGRQFAKLEEPYPNGPKS